MTSVQYFIQQTRFNLSGVRNNSLLKVSHSGPGLPVRFLIASSSVADPVHFFPDPVFKIRIWIRIRVTQKRPDLTGSGSGSYLDMFLMFSKIFFV